MQLLYGGAAALAVAALYYAWRVWFTKHRQRMLRERVAYMLWVMADRVE